MVKEYVETIVSLFRMNAESKEYFLSKVNDSPVQIQMLLGLRAQESLLTTDRAEQINCLHPWELPIASIQHNAADQQLLLAGKLEINPELFVDDAPTFHVHRTRIAELVREFKLAHGMKNSEPHVEHDSKDSIQKIQFSDEAFQW